MTQTSEYSLELLGALDFAAQMHRNQRRKGVDQQPYINHPIQVAEVLASVGLIADQATLIAAILHDTIEDTEATPKELGGRFGVEVCDLVLEVSDDKSIPKDERKRLQIEHAAQLSDKAKLIKIADKICNVRDIGLTPPEGWGVERRRGYFDWAEKVVHACGPVNAELEKYFVCCLNDARSRLA